MLSNLLKSHREKVANPGFEFRQPSPSIRVLSALP